MRIGSRYRISNWRILVFVLTIIMTSVVGKVIYAPIEGNLAVQSLNDPVASRAMVVFEQSKYTVYVGCAFINILAFSVMISGISRVNPVVESKD